MSANPSSSTSTTSFSNGDVEHHNNTGKRTVNPPCAEGETTSVPPEWSLFLEATHEKRMLYQSLTSFWTDASMHDSILNSVMAYAGPSGRANLDDEDDEDGEMELRRKMIERRERMDPAGVQLDLRDE